jgi:DNA-binding CsgD family transcriptional regulator
MASINSAQLTQCAQDVLNLMSKSNVEKVFAPALFFSTWTVHEHVKRSFEKFQGHPHTEAVLAYLQKQVPFTRRTPSRRQALGSLSDQGLNFIFRLRVANGTIPPPPFEVLSWQGGFDMLTTLLTNRQKQPRTKPTETTSYEKDSFSLGRLFGGGCCRCSNHPVGSNRLVAVPEQC